MFALAIHYLNGWAMAAADGAKKQQAEWPPHPDRVFMALAAAWFETGEDPAEGAALQWLESLPSPAIHATAHTSRALVTSYVPVNDTRVGRKLPSSNDLGKLKDAGLGVLGEFRSRQPRAFPIAIPAEPVAHLIWPDTDVTAHRPALEQLLRKLTHVGHSASFVQGWLDDQPPQANLIPGIGLGARRLRSAQTGRLDYLRRCHNRSAVIDYGDLNAEINQSKELIKENKYPPRADWDDFPDALLLVGESAVKQHPRYPAAKNEDPDEAGELVSELVGDGELTKIRDYLEELGSTDPLVLVSAHAVERAGINSIPSALARRIGEQLNLDYEQGVIQTNVVSHTGADGYGRMARQAAFDGPVAKGQAYVMVDDFIGQGGTLANLRGFLMKQGGRVVGAIALTGKPYSAKLNPTPEQLDELRKTHGKSLEKWWKEHFGHPFTRLTQSEARYLARSPDAEQIRARIIAAKQEGGHAGGGRSVREEKARLADLEQQLTDRFPNGRPISLRPEPAHWQPYVPVAEEADMDVSPNLFDPNLLVFALTGKRLSLPATLQLTAALRGALLKACDQQPQPEWLTGHQPDGKPSKAPHLAMLPLPFVDAEHADGRVMGLALALPKSVDPAEIGECLNDFLIDAETGLGQAHRLFDGRWFECGMELEMREHPPLSLSSQRWTRAAEVWASVTPVVLDRHFDGKNRWDKAEETIKDGCERIGLPRPVNVRMQPVSEVRGVPHARDFPYLTRKSDGGRRHHSHVVLQFEQPVTGPVFIGAGRFRGYGLCLPMGELEPVQGGSS